ncbi:MAG: hypothetical protein L0Y72_30815 [Gemmataceae bacterium]|nr:hypothetical protein [Gemmataceae bacterium]MCI0743441.1 hypothetical protein [Gemmataceae bacterium]
MIWFHCKQCGKVHGRPENSIGATIFCDCGQGLVVPWESTAPEPPAPTPTEAPNLPPALKLDPVTFEMAAPPRERGSSGPQRERDSSGSPPVRVRAKRRILRHDPHHCLNHENTTKQEACTDCGENFCADCLVQFQGQALCGPCKNFRVKNMQRDLPRSAWAIASVLVALVAGLLFFLILPTGLGGLPWKSPILLAPQAAAIVLGIVALRDIERNDKLAGRSLALTGIIAASVTSVFLVLLLFYVPVRWT